MMSDDTAQAAHTMATVVASRLDGHEKICGERYGEIKSSFDRVHKRLDLIFGCVILVLASMLAWIVTSGKLPWVSG